MHSHRRLLSLVQPSKPSLPKQRRRKGMSAFPSVTYYIITCRSLCIHMSLTMYSHVAHYVFTCHSLCIHMSLTMYPPVTHYVFTCHSLCIHMSFITCLTLSPTTTLLCVVYSYSIVSFLYPQRVQGIVTVTAEMDSLRAELRALSERRVTESTEAAQRSI